MDPIHLIEQEWPVIMAAPWIAAGLLLLGAIPAWWFRGHSAKSEIAGLRAQIAAGDAQLSVEASRLALARDQLGAQAEDLARARANLEMLQLQQRTGATSGQIASTTTSLLENVARVTTANTEASHTISAINFTVGGIGDVRPTDRHPPYLIPADITKPGGVKTVK